MNLTTQAVIKPDYQRPKAACATRKAKPVLMERLGSGELGWRNCGTPRKEADACTAQHFCLL